MGLLIDGSWSTAWYDIEKTDGKFVREDAGFRHWVTADGAAGPPVRLVLKPSLGATIFMCRMRALGRIGR